MKAIAVLDARYLADLGQAPAYCPTCGQPTARAGDYLLSDAISDYRIEKGDERDSASSIAARLNHILDFLAATDQIAATCADAASKKFAEDFRKWSRKQPVRWRNKAGEVTAEKQRTAAATEESLSQLRAVLNHAVAEERSDKRPAFKVKGRKKVTAARKVHCDESVLADMFIYAAEQKKRRGALHSFLAGSLGTVARPDSVVDISTAPERRQWHPGSPVLDLNPAGREQTNKYRPVIPVVPFMAAWLASADGWLVNYYGRPVQDVDRSWKAMLKELKLPVTRDWMPYILRHSLATMIRDRRPDPWELSGFMGHRMLGTTETYAMGRLFPTVADALNDIIAKVESRAGKAMHRSCTGAPSNVVSIKGAKNA